MNIQEIIKSAQEETSGEVHSFEVAAWSTDEKPFIIHHRSFTLADVTWIEQQSGGVKSKSLIYTIIRKALTPEGKKLFTIADFNFLSKGVKSHVMIGIVNEMNKADMGVDYEKE